MNEEVTKQNGGTEAESQNPKKPVTRVKLFTRKAATTTTTKSTPNDGNTVQTDTPQGTVIRHRTTAGTVFGRISDALSRAFRRLFILGVIIVIVCALAPEVKEEVPVLYEFGHGMLRTTESLLRFMIRFFVNLFSFNFKAMISEPWAILEEGWKAMISWFMTIH